MGNSREDVEWIDEATRRFHLRTGFYPDSEEVIRQIRLYRRDCLIPGRRWWSKFEIKKRSLERFAMTEAIRRIANHKNEDPIRVLYAFKSEVDDMLAESEHSRTWAFCGQMWDAIGGLLEYLG